MLSDKDLVIEDEIKILVRSNSLWWKSKVIMDRRSPKYACRWQRALMTIHHQANLSIRPR